MIMLSMLFRVGSIFDNCNATCATNHYVIAYSRQAVIGLAYRATVKQG
jgi:hypothetical protein